MARHNCVEQTGDICPRCENEAEERVYGIERGGMAADYEAERYERQRDAWWGDA